jgi:hypothetical protein
VARWFRLGLSVAGPFVGRCLTSLAVLRFHSPLIKLDGRFSRIQLSDKAFLIVEFTRSLTKPSRLSSFELVEPQLLVQVCVRVSCRALTPYLELRAQPLTHPVADVMVDLTIGRVDRPGAKIVGPTP